MPKPHGSYDDWKGSTNDLHLSNGDILIDAEVIDLWMAPSGQPHALACLHKSQVINVPFDKIMWYVIKH